MSPLRGTPREARVVLWPQGRFVPRQSGAGGDTFFPAQRLPFRTLWCQSPDSRAASVLDLAYVSEVWHLAWFSRKPKREYCHPVPRGRRPGSLRSPPQRRPEAGLEYRQLLASCLMPPPRALPHISQVPGPLPNFSRARLVFCNCSKIRNWQCYCNHSDSTNFFPNAILN